MSPRTLSLAVVGIDYPNKRGPGRRFEIALCRPGDLVQLVPEPKNPADENAIMVMSERGVQLGYITAERAPLILKLLAEGEVRAIFQEEQQWCAVIRATFDGSEPVLPPASPPPAAPLPMRTYPRRRDLPEGSQLPRIEPEDVGDYIPPDD